MNVTTPPEVHTEVLGLTLVMGGSTSVPTLRRTGVFWEELEAEPQPEQ